MRTGKLDIQSTTYMEMIDITTHIEKITTTSEIETGFCFLFNPHTTSGLTINEGADPDVREDIITGLKHIVPMRLHYQHVEGNSPSHIMASLMGCSLTIFIENSRPFLGQWQKIFFCEFDGPRSRQIHWRLAANI
ncbi:MAG: secondary thiamine-phosphate synthase enzyme YjbQ [Desulfoprunum sp.]|nr:secondary thiamine-phosphate synthase enzyme YjbQ [Desulfoprunum sp.]